MAGGNWSIIDEKIDPKVVKQQNNLFCGAACGEMLLKSKGIEGINQSAIARHTSSPVDVATLAEVLNLFTPMALGKWQGRGFLYGTSYQETVEWLTNKGIWAAELRELGKGIGHLVIVDRFDELSRLCIRDPWEGTSYKIKIREFTNYWTLRGVRWIQKP